MNNLYPQVRLEDWEQRLSEVIYKSQHRPFKYGSNDCALFVARCIEAVTGEKVAEDVLETYTSEIGALRIVASNGGTLRAAVSKIIHREAQEIDKVQAGDPILYRSTFEEHLGVCLGEFSAVTGDRGLIEMRTNLCDCCWNL